MYVFKIITWSLPVVIFGHLMVIQSGCGINSFIGTIQWDFQYLECPWLLCWNLAKGIFISEIDCAYQNLKKWPLDGLNGDFILSKLKNQLDLDSKSIKKVGADSRYYGLQLLKNCLLFSTSRMRSLRFLKLIYGR